MIRVQIHLAETDEDDKHPVIDYTCLDCHKDEQKNELVIKHIDNSMERIDYDCIMRYRIWRSPTMSTPTTEFTVKEIYKDIVNDLK